MRIGVLALQGDFAAHRKVLERLGCECPEIRQPSQLDGLDGLVLPGGESTTMLKFLNNEGFIEPLCAFKGAFFGTCAGAILLAKGVTNPSQPSLGVLDLDVRRNAYGRQLESFIAEVDSRAFGAKPFEMVFIRAPVIERIGAGVETLVEHDGRPVLVRQGKHLVATFHPELSTDDRIHRMFVEGIAAGGR
jgi:5'-phosphate synthase pdxT subunit